MENLFNKINSLNDPFLLQAEIDETKNQLGVSFLFENIALLNPTAVLVFLQSLSQSEISMHIEKLLNLLRKSRGYSIEDTIITILMKAYSPTIVKELLHSYRNCTIPTKVKIIKYLLAHETDISFNALQEIESFEQEVLPRQLLNKWKNNLQVIIAVSALNEEMDALTEGLKATAIQSRAQNDGETELLNPKTNLPFAILRAVGEAGNPECRNILEKLLSKYNPSIVILFGIAAAIPKRAKMKDLIITSKVLDLRLCKIGDPIEFQPKLHTSKKSKYAPFQISDIQTNLKKELGEEIRIHEDLIIGSSDNLSRSSEYVDAASKTHRKLGGLEMESASVAEVCCSKNIPFCIIKACTDYGDHLKSDEVRLQCCKIAATALLASPLMKP